MSDNNQDKKGVNVTERPRASTSDSSEGSYIKPPSLRSPRTARFAEATAVNSPVEPTQAGRNPFVQPPLPTTNHYMAQPQPADVGFGYINKHDSVEMPDERDNNGYYAPTTPKTPLRSPLKSAMKTPGAAPKDMNAIFSPTFKNEDLLEKQEKHTEKEQARDIRIKARVRLAKVMLRGVNFSCSLIVLAMLGTVFTIFNTTKLLPTRNTLPPWAPNQQIWPQVTLLVIACISLVASIFVFYAYFKGGHRRAEKAAVYYTAFACAFFVFSIVMWGIGAGLLQGSRNSGNGQDMWGWSCKDNVRKQLFENEVSYDLMCRLQNWSLLCCIIEVVVETITIAVYGVVFYRFYSKRKLRQSMASRDKARSDLYIAQLRSQSAPNTPGMMNAPYSARDGGWHPQTPRSPAAGFQQGPDLEAGGSPTQYASASSTPKATPFRLQAPPIKIQGATPRLDQGEGFSPVATNARDRSITPPHGQDQRSPLMIDTGHGVGEHGMGMMSPGLPVTETQQEHMFAAPGETVYEAVAVPGAYEETARSPGHDGRMHFPG